MKPKESWRGGGENREGLADGGLAQRTSGAVKNRENRVLDQGELSAKKTSCSPAKIGVQYIVKSPGPPRRATPYPEAHGPCEPSEVS